MLDLAHIAVIITAAGRGTRMGGAPKQWRDLAGRSVLARSIDAFAGFGRIVVVVGPEDMAHALETLGGASRWSRAARRVPIVSAPGWNCWKAAP